MDVIIYNENDEIIGEITKSKTDKGYWFAGYDNKNRTRRIIKLFKGKRQAIDFLKSKSVNQLTSEECDAFYIEKTKSLLEPIVREVIKKELDPIKMMTNNEINDWFKTMLNRVVINPDDFSNRNNSQAICPSQNPNVSQACTGDCQYCKNP